MRNKQKKDLELLQECSKLTKCPLCQGIISHTIDKCECISCGFFLSKDCCHGEEKEIKKGFDKK